MYCTEYGAIWDHFFFKVYFTMKKIQNEEEVFEAYAECANERGWNINMNISVSPLL